MTPNQAATYAAIGLAAVAAYQLLKGKAKPVETRQPAEVARRDALFSFANLQASQWGLLNMDNLSASWGTGQITA